MIQDARKNGQATKPETAAEVYGERQREIAAMIEWIGEAIDDHATRAAAQPGNWCFAGDLGHVRDELKQVLVFVASEPESKIQDALNALAH